MLALYLGLATQGIEWKGCLCDFKTASPYKSNISAKPSDLTCYIWISDMEIIIQIPFVQTNNFIDICVAND